MQGSRFFLEIVTWNAQSSIRPVGERTATGGAQSTPSICGDWANEEIFYQRTLAAGGESSRVSVNLAQVYVRGGDWVRAERILRRVLETMPDYPIARINLGNVLLHAGKTAEAETFFRTLCNSD